MRETGTREIITREKIAGEIILREAAISDLPRLEELEQKIIDYERPFDASIKSSDVSYYDLPSLISSPRAQLLVLDIDNQIVGCGYARIQSSKQCVTHTEHCYLGFIYVVEEYRGHQLARVIIERLIDWGKNQGLSHVQLGVYSENISAIRAYEKLGFRNLSQCMELIIDGSNPNHAISNI